MVKHNFNDPGGRRGHRPRGVSDGLFRKSEVKSEIEYDDADAAGRRKVNAQSAAWTPRNQSVDPDKELYHKVCKQRELERKVRKSKTEADMLEAAGDSEGAKEVRRRMTEQNKALKSYCEGNGLKYRSDRVRTYGAIAPKKALDKSAESGIIKLSSKFINPTDQLYTNANKIKPLEGYGDIIIHGSPDSLLINGLNGEQWEYGAKEAAEMIRNSREFHGQPIRLIACQTGAKENGIAQQIADELGVDVMAPTEIANVDINGEIFISDNNELAEIWNTSSEEERKNIRQTGEWKLFKPNKG